MGIVSMAIRKIRFCHFIDDIPLLFFSFIISPLWLRFLLVSNLEKLLTKSPRALHFLHFFVWKNCVFFTSTIRLYYMGIKKSIHNSAKKLNYSAIILLTKIFHFVKICVYFRKMHRKYLTFWCYCSNLSDFRHSLGEKVKRL